jgi:ribosomal protein S27E
VWYDILTLSSDAISRLTQTVGNLDSLLKSNHHNIHQDLQSVKDLITTEAASNTGYYTIIDSQLRPNQHSNHQDPQSIKSLVISQFQHLNERFPSQAGPSSALAQRFPYGLAVSSATTAGNAARIFRCFTDRPIMAGSNQDTMVALARSHSSLSPHQINDTLENLETVIQFVMAYVLIALEELLIRLPQVLIIARMMQVLPRAIPLMRQDCIRFEDALGRVQNLQYQQFQYWPIFEAMIKTRFEDVPGYGKILRRRYTLMCPGLHGQRLVAASWSQHVFPGMAVFMAVDVKVPDFHDGRCPKCSRSNTSSHSATGLRCYSCGLVFSKGIAANIGIAGGATESENSGARVEQSHPNGRLMSGPSTEAGDNEATNLNDEFTDSEDATENLKVFKRVNLLQKPIIPADIRGNGEIREPLDHRYRKRHNAKKFFMVGRVFAMLWHEDGDNKGGHISHVEPLRGNKKGKHKEIVYSHIRRMAVVRMSWILLVPSNKHLQSRRCRKKRSQCPGPNRSLRYLHGRYNACCRGSRERYDAQEANCSHRGERRTETSLHEPYQFWKDLQRGMECYGHERGQGT